MREICLCFMCLKDKKISADISGFYDNQISILVLKNLNWAVTFLKIEIGFSSLSL